MADYVDETIPQNSESPTLGAQRIRETRKGFNDLLKVEHDISDDETTSGFHGTNVTGEADTSIASPPTGYGRFGWKVISGVTELFYRDDAGNEVQVTTAGKLGAEATDLLANDIESKGVINPTAYNTTNGGFKDEDNMASDSATAVASQQSIKAYVDKRDVNGTLETVNIKYITGLASGTTKTIAHGIADYDDILSVVIHLRGEEGGGDTDYFIADYRSGAGGVVSYYWARYDATNIIINASSSSVFDGNTRYRIKIEYLA